VVRARQLPRELVAHACRRVAAACTSESGARAALLGLDVIHACPLRESERERERARARERVRERERERERARERQCESERASEGCLLSAHKQEAQHTQEKDEPEEEEEEEEEEEYYLVDVNHFPGFHGMASFPEALALLIQRRLLLARTLLPQPPPRALEEEETGGGEGGGGGGGDWVVTIARAGRHGKAEERAACTNVWEDTEEIGCIEPLIGCIEPLQPLISMSQ
jgi:hypothetical protein